MPATDFPAIVVARFLQANGYNETLSTLVVEAGLPQDAGALGPGDLTIEKVLEEKKIFDLSLRFEKVGVSDDGEKGWCIPAPTLPEQIDSLPTSTNLLHVSVDDVEDFPTAGVRSKVILATTADRRLNLLSAHDPNYQLFASQTHLHDSPILSCAVLSRRWLLSTSMSGQLVLSDLRSQTILDQAKDHNKYVVKVAVLDEEDEEGSFLVATAGWDAKVFVYRSKLVRGEGGTSRTLGKPIASISLKSNPECILFIRHPESSKVLLLVSIRDSTYIYFYGLPEERMTASSDAEATATTSISTPLSLILVEKQNLAPHSNAWIAFSPSSFAQCPTDPTLLAVATSSVPYMKLLFVRLRLPPLPSTSSTQSPVMAPDAMTSPPATQAAQTRDALRRADAEAVAIISHTSTLAPQTPYSTPQVCWRPDGSGVWVNGDDGVVRGVEARTGKVFQTLREGGHDAGSKIRCICAGVGKGGREIMLSGGFDRKLVLWSIVD